jgi:hypothetical protein
MLAIVEVLQGLSIGLLSAAALACSSGPEQMYLGPEMARADVAVLGDSAEVSVCAIDGTRTSGSEWALLPGSHRIMVRVRFWPRVSNVNWKIESYCQVELDAEPGTEYVTFVRTRTVATPTETLKFSIGIMEKGSTRPHALGRSCSPTRPRQCQ